MLSRWHHIGVQESRQASTAELPPHYHSHGTMPLSSFPSKQHMKAQVKGSNIYNAAVIDSPISASEGDPTDAARVVKAA